MVVIITENAKKLKYSKSLMMHIMNSLVDFLTLALRVVNSFLVQLKVARSEVHKSKSVPAGG